MTFSCTRSLLAALLFLGQLSGVLHVLGHMGERGCAHVPHAASAHGALAGDAHARAHVAACVAALDVRGEPGGTSEHDGNLCGLCLVSAGGVGPVDTAPPRASLPRGDHDVTARASAPPAAHRTLPHPARAPPAVLS